MGDRCELLLFRDWDAAWHTRVRPWLAAPAALRRDHVLVPTRGQAQALKRRCVREGVPLLGVEFLTPGLARRKWQALVPAARPALGRELLLLNLRALIAQRLEPLAPEDAAWGFWKSLQSDPERALADFDDLLHAGFTAADFPLPALREVLGELERRVEEMGYDLAPVQQIAAALAAPLPGSPRLGGRLLVHGFSAEHGREFFALAALARRAADLTVLLPEPEAGGSAASDEGWIEAWSTLLGVEPQLPASDVPEPAGAAVARLWSGEGGGAPPATVLVGHTRADEMQLVAERVGELLAGGSGDIAVVFPQADAAHLRLARLLEARGVPFNDLLDTAGASAVEIQLQRDLLAFHARGGRLEELLRLWPRLHALGLTPTDPGTARDVVGRVFDDRQTHALAAVQAALAARNRPDWQEVARVAGLLLPPWPDRLPLAEALRRFEETCTALRLPVPAAWPALRDYATRDPQPLPLAVVVATLDSFLPPQARANGVPGHGRFAPVTLTTWRRAAALAWSDVIFVESNAGVWPRRHEPSCWLTDEQREALDERGRFTFGLRTSDERTRRERDGWRGVARNTSGSVSFSAALFDEEDPELRLAPNPWLERVLLADPAAAAAGIEAAFAARAQVRGPGAEPADPALEAWTGIWRRRRDPAAPFDGHFLCGDPAATRPARLAARLVERAVEDPAVLWFEGVLGQQRIPWEPLRRVRKKALGSIAHRLLARALRGAPAGADFGPLPAEAVARERLGRALDEWRERHPRDRYWDSFAAELGELARVLLAQVYVLGGGNFVAVEVGIPAGTMIPLGSGGAMQEVTGRMDLVLSDRPGWAGARVEIVDFKTGADTRLSVQALARGDSLQLGVYLAAAAALGAADGRVWMLKADGRPPAAVALSELPLALVALDRLAVHLATGRYGALTRDRTEFASGFEWPLACAPVPFVVLQRKFAATFGAERAGEGDDE